ncbi:hypothetical protein XELAEV_1800773922mg, partial [Xenopus laevis]
KEAFITSTTSIFPRTSLPT